MTGADMKRTNYIICKTAAYLLAVLVAVIVVAGSSSDAFAEDTGIPEGYQPPNYGNVLPYSMKNIFETETVTVSGIEVRPERYNYGSSDTITFRIFNSTTQETEYIAEAVPDDDLYCYVLPDLELKKYHNYIFFCEDRDYQLGTSKYVQILPAEEPEAYDGPGAYDFKTDSSYTFEKLESIAVYKRSEPCEDPFAYNRYTIVDLERNPGLPVEYDGQGTSGIRFRLVSDEETIETVSENGRLYANLIEDIQYMVYVDDDEYAIEPFPLSVKDKSEFGSRRYCYDHSTCHRVDEFTLLRKDELPSQHDQYHRIVSLNGRTVVSGMMFNDLLLISRDPGSKVLEGISGTEVLNGQKHEIVELTAVNPHRWEISKLEANEFRVTHDLGNRRKPLHVYSADNGSLNELSFTIPSAGKAAFTVDRISRVPLVIVYEEEKSETPADKPSDDPSGKSSAKTKQKAPKATTIKNAKAGRKKAVIYWKKVSGISGYQIQYSLKKSFKKGARKVVAGKRLYRKAFKKLKKGKTYYFRIRTFKKTSSGRIYSKWSKPVKVRIK